MKPDGYCYYQRKFLNRPGHNAGAYVLATVDSGGSYGALTIADCRRLITLEFHTRESGDRSNSLHKADVLIQTLTDMRAALAARPPRPRRVR